MKPKPNPRSVLALLLVLLVSLGLAGPAFAADTASTMRLSKTEGTVTVTSPSMRKLPLTDNMLLSSGCTVETAAASYAWINLDSTKLIKLDAYSKVEFRKSGKNLEVLLKDGGIYGDVSKPLESDESLNILASNTITSIRGTKVSIRKDGNRIQVTCVEGKVTTIPIRNQSKTSITVSSGQTVPIVDMGEKLESLVSNINLKDLPGFIQMDLTKNGPYTLGGQTITPVMAEQRLQQDANDSAENAPSESSSAQVTKPVWFIETGNAHITIGGDGGSSTGNTNSDGSSSTHNTYSSGSNSSAAMYTLTLNANGGEVSPTEITTTNTSPVHSLPTPTRDGYAFTGWFTDAACTQSYDLSSPVTGSLTLYAGWEENDTPSPGPTTYQVTFDSKGGTAVEAQTVEKDSTAIEPTEPTREGYTFGGWYSDNECTMSYNFSTPVTENLTLYAKWTSTTTSPDSYTITFESNGGTAVETQTIEKNGTATKPSDPTWEGFSFEGWYLDNALTMPYEFSTPVTENMTLYAKWTAGSDVTLTLSSDANADMKKLTSLLKLESCKKITVVKGEDSTGSLIDNITVPSGKTLEITDGVTVENGVTVMGTLKSSGTIKAGDAEAALTVNGTGDCVIITDGTVDGGDKIALYMISGRVKGGNVVASKLENTLAVDDNTKEEWAFSGICDYNTTREIYMGNKIGGKYSLNWGGPARYGFQSGVSGTHAVILTDCTNDGEFNNSSLGDDVYWDLNGHTYSITGSTEIGPYSILITDSKGGGCFKLGSSLALTGSGSIKTQNTNLVNISNLTDYQFSDTPDNGYYALELKEVSP